MSALPYKLSCSMYGHNGDVRSVTATEDGKIVSGSRDMTAKLWTPNGSGIGYKEHLTLASHKNFVSCVCALPPGDKYTNGLIITGSNDKGIRVFDGTQSEPIAILNGHTNTVCKIVAGIDQNIILSSSWDQTAKMWNLLSFKSIAQYVGHEAAVWSIAQLPCGLVATGSADRQIKIWVTNGTCLNTLLGHTDCIRDLAVCAPKEILSCSNDATIKQWNVESGQCLNTFYGHGHFIYSISHLAEDSLSFVTSSEDHTVKLWKNGEVVETIDVPATSVWSVSRMPNGDIVTGSSDGVVRVFSRDASRQASQQELNAYEEQISNLENSASQEIGGIKVSELPGEEALLVKGTKEGQTRIIKVGNNVVAYRWSTGQEKWNLIGNVTGSTDSQGVDPSEKPKYRGKEYDYVFSVDIEPGKPLLKLPYNKTDDPWHAAQKFIHDNQLNQNFLEEVANFIIRNSDFPKERARSDASEFVDPFTGEGRYIPAANSDANETNANANFPEVLKRHGSKASEGNPSTYFPQKEFVRFDQANINLIFEKLLEFNEKMDNKNVVSSNKIESLIKICDSGASCKTEDIETLYKLLDWPEDIVFPVLDVMRLAIRNPEVNSLLCNEKLIPKLISYLSPNSGASSNTMLALRVLANMMSADAGLKLASKNKSKLLKIIDDIQPPYTKPVQIAMSTLLLNLAVMLRRTETPSGLTEELSVAEHILSRITDQEALFRSLVALGTLVVDASDRQKLGTAFEAILLKHQSDSSFGPKIRQCCQHVLQVLR